MRVKSVTVAALLSTVVSSSFAIPGPLPPLNPSASFDNTVNGAFQDTWGFSLPGLSIVAVSITNNEIVLGGADFGGILTFSGFIDLPVGADVPLSYSTNTIIGPDGSQIHVQRLEGNALLAAGPYSLVVAGLGITGLSASYGGNIVATAVPELETYVMMLAGLSVIGLLVARRRHRG